MEAKDKKKLKKRLRKIDEYNTFLNYRLTKAEDLIKELHELITYEVLMTFRQKKNK